MGSQRERGLNEDENIHALGGDGRKSPGPLHSEHQHSDRSPGIHSLLIEGIECDKSWPSCLYCPRKVFGHYIEVRSMYHYHVRLDQGFLLGPNMTIGMMWKHKSTSIKNPMKFGMMNNGAESEKIKINNNISHGFLQIKHLAVLYLFTLFPVSSGQPVWWWIIEALTSV